MTFAIAGSGGQHALTAAGGSGASPYTLSFPNPITPGNNVVGFIVSYNNNNACAVTDGTNTYETGSWTIGATSNYCLAPFWGAGLTGSSITTLTFTQSSGVLISVGMIEVSGGASSNSAFYNSSAGGQDGGTPSASGSAGSAIGAAGCLIISAVHTYVGDTPAVSDGYLTVLDQITSEQYASLTCDAYLLNATVSVDPSYNMFTATGWEVVGAAFNPAPAAATCTGQLSLVGVGCSIGWTPALIGAGAFRFAKALKDNKVTTRRRLLLPLRRSLIGHNGGPKFDDN